MYQSTNIALRRLGRAHLLPSRPKLLTTSPSPVSLTGTQASVRWPERERERERESFIRNNLHNGVVSGAARVTRTYNLKRRAFSLYILSLHAQHFHRSNLVPHNMEPSLDHISRASPQRIPRCQSCRCCQSPSPPLRPLPGPRAPLPFSLSVPVIYLALARGCMFFCLLQAIKSSLC